MSVAAVILDLDLTLVDTNCLAHLRKARKWPEVYLGIPQTNLYDGIQELFATIRSLDLPIGIVTTSPSPYAKKLLAHHGLSFDALVGYHDAPPKPRPDPMLLCADRMNVRPEDVVSAGDDAKDILAGNAAGMVSVATLWGCISRDTLLASDPDHVVETPADLGELIGRL